MPTQPVKGKSRAKILIVDDKDQMRDVLRKFLTAEGYTVETAENGKDALKKFAGNSFELVLSDIKMPAMDGSELLAYITATIVLPDGTPLPPLESAPASSENSLPPKIPNDAPAPGQEELPYGIPAAGNKGMVHSPYAPDKGFIDVEGFKRGTRVECPYTGKHFRVP